MMEGNFEEGESGFYTVLNAVENEFLNQKLESDQYGIYYSVRFSGDADTYLWQAKTAPEDGKAYYGHVEKSKSGKSMRFKRDKEPEDTARPSNATVKSDDKAYLKDLSDYPVRIFNGGLNYAKDLGLNLLETSDRNAYLEFVQSVCEELLTMSDNIRSGTQTLVKPAQKPFEEASAKIIRETKAKQAVIEDPFPSDEDYHED